MTQFHQCAEPPTGCSNPPLKRDSFIQRVATEAEMKKAQRAWLDYDADGRQDEQAFKDGFLLGLRAEK